MPWVNGLDGDLLRRWRRAVEKTADRGVLRACQQVATGAKECMNAGESVPVDYLIGLAQKEMKVPRDEIEAHLVMLGIGVVMSLHRDEFVDE